MADRHESILRQLHHKVDFCVVGGGLAGMLAAIAAARHGVKTALIQDRPVLGGNASSEIRMWPLGCRGKNNRETGIFEEILIENMYRNPYRNYSIWDSILYEKARFQPNLQLFLNCTVTDVEMNGDRVQQVSGWQLTTYTRHTIAADYFADCSGDSILAPLTGAEFKVGREAAGEYNEDIAPGQADKKTMGLSCLLQATETAKPVEFIPPKWAHVYATDEELPFRDHDLSKPNTNFWWIELGGTRDSIHDTEDIRDELLKVVFGVWDHIKNRGDHQADNWELSWVGFLPGKRESRRYEGDYVLNQNDIRAEGRFDDLVAYGGWTMDDHHPEGMMYSRKPTVFHEAPAPYGIPYRCLYSKNIENLFFAGRNISATHAALSSTRVMATCAVIGQAMGTAASLAVEYGLSPRQVYQEKIVELKQRLMEDDCYLPWNARRMPPLTEAAELTAAEGEPSPLLNGHDRPIGDQDNGWVGSLGSWVQYRWSSPCHVRRIRFVFDSDLERISCTGHSDLRRKPMLANKFLNMEPFGFPETMIKAFRIEYLDEHGRWSLLQQVKDNYQRLVYVDVDVTTAAVRFVPEATWGSSDAHLFGFDVS